MSITKTLKKINFETNIGIKSIQPLEKLSNDSLNISTQISTTSKQISSITTQNLLYVIENIVSICPTEKTDLSNKIWLRYDKTNKKALDNNQNIFKNFIKQQNLFEELTGISSTRPEIIMITDFVPLFSKTQNTNNLSKKSYKNSYYTNEGQYVDTKFNFEQFASLEMTNHLKYIVARENRSTSSTYDKMSKQKTDLFLKIGDLRTIMGNLTQILQSFNSTKQLFDLRNFVHTTTYDNTSSIFEQLTNDISYSTESLLNFVSKQLPTTTSLSSVLAQYGYTKSSIKNDFTSTKIWLQTVCELNNILKNYSYKLFDQNIELIKQDKNAYKILKPVNTVNVNKLFVDLSISIPTVHAINSIIATTVPGIQKFISSGFEQINETSQDLIDKISLLIWMFSKEYRYSNGLVKSDVQQTLLSTFDYSITTQNNSLFDNIFGLEQSTINQTTDVTRNNLRALAYEKNDNKNILNFEGQIIETVKGDFIPGSEFYIDYLLDNISTSGKVDTTRIEHFINRLSTIKNGINVVANGMNWLCESTTDNITATTQQTERILTSPIDLFTYIQNLFVDEQTNLIKLECSTDMLSAILAMASNDQQMKSMLFMLCMFQIFDQNMIVDTITYQTTLSNLIQHIQNLTPTLKLNSQVTKVQRLPIASINEMLDLNSSSYIWKQILQIMKNVYATLIENNEVVVSSKTRYSGITDSTMLMIIFDVIVSLFEKYSNLQIGPNGPMMSYKNVQHTLSILTIPVKGTQTSDIFTVYDKLNFEKSQIISGFVSIIGTIHALQMKLQTFVNYMKSAQTTNVLKSYLQNALQTIDDVKMTKLLFNEQQMMLNTSTIYDLFDRMNTQAARSVDFNDDNVIDDKDLLIVLDESLITPKLRNYFNLIFSDSSFVNNIGNKNILTVGVPFGFVENLKQKLSNLHSGVNLKQNDIIKINVYKTNIQNPDLIFKPITFLFELSRFQVRNPKLLFDLSQSSNIEDAIKLLPMRDILQNSHISNDSISYGKISSELDNMVQSIDKIKGQQNSRFSTQKAFDSQEYNFLTADDKNELLINHALSYMLEIYIKALTDLNVGDYKFVINPLNFDIQTKKDLAQELVKQKLQDILQQISSTPNSPGKLFVKQSVSSSRINTINKKQQATNLAQIIEQLTQRQIKQITQELIKINKIVNSTTSLSDSSSVISSILAPKQFDRVFNLIVDSNDFEIDVDKMSSTTHGMSTLQALLKDGEIIMTPTSLSKFQTTILQKQKNLIAQNKVFYKERHRNKNNGDIIFEKYYVTIDTFGENII